VPEANFPTEIKLHQKSRVMEIVLRRDAEARREPPGLAKKGPHTESTESAEVFSVDSVDSV